MSEDCVTAVRKRIKGIAFPGETEELWEENNEAVDKFIEDTTIRLLVVYKDCDNKLHVEYDMPSKARDLLYYFVRKEGAAITQHTFEKVVQIHTAHGNPAERILNYMIGLHAPVIAMTDPKDKNIKDNYTAAMHECLIFHMDHVHKMDGRTVLYIPAEALKLSPEEACKDKPLLQRMEVVVIHWMDQIKELLNEKEKNTMNNNCSPLQEIGFWKNRSSQLLAMSKQLQKPEVKHIQDILQLSQSLYLKHFRKLIKEIQDCFLEAESNMKYLSILKQPCEELAQLKPDQIIPKMKNLVNLIRVVWHYSVHYNTSEMIVGLFLKMTNEIIRLCCQSISLDKIFDGYVLSSRQILHDCIQCCETWKEVYLQVARINCKHNPKGWSLDHTSFFVMTDAFLHRLTDLLEVCDCQYELARWVDGQQRPLPNFGGVQSAAFTSSLLQIEGDLQQGLKRLRSVDKDILDIETREWHTEFSSFCGLLKRLDFDMHTLIISVFKNVYSVKEGLRLLRIFRPMTSQETIKCIIEEKVDDVYNIVYKEIKMVNKELAERTSFYTTPYYVPQKAAKAQWLRALKSRLEQPMQLVQNADFLPESSSRTQLMATYDQLMKSLDEMEKRNFNEWKQNLDPYWYKKLERPLLVQCKDNSGVLNVNFDNTLLDLFTELEYWDRLEYEYEIPLGHHNILQDRDDFRDLWQRAKLLVYSYNRIIESLSPDNLVLFREKIRFIDKKIQPGFTKLMWLKKEASNIFIRDSLSLIDKVQLLVERHKVFTESISTLCRQISETLLVRLDENTVYRNLQFEDDQAAHRQSQLQILRSAHQGIADKMSTIHSAFSSDDPKFQESWLTYADKVDHQVEEALRANIRNSLRKISRAIDGNNKISSNPLFAVLVGLEKGSPRVTRELEFSPTFAKLTEMVNILPQLMSTVSEFKRLSELLGSQQSQGNPFHVNIEQDEEIKKIQAAIITSVTANASQAQSYLKTWDKYRTIWDINMDIFMQRQKKLNIPASIFDQDILRYKDKATSAKKEETVMNVGCLMLDCSMLKFAVVEHCDKWQTKIAKQLSHMASSQLEIFLDSLNNSTKRLNKPPQTLEELRERLEFLKTLQGDVDETKAKILAIHDQFAILDKHDVTVDWTIRDLHKTLDGEWLSFQQVMIDSELVLQKLKEKFKNSFMLSYEEFQRKSQAILQDFNKTGPFDSALKTTIALEQVAKYCSELETLQQEESNILHTLSFLGAEQPPSKFIQILEKDIANLQRVWKLSEEWNNNWNVWKVCSFATLHVESMESPLQDMLKTINTLLTQLKDKEWDIVNFSKNKIEQFKLTIPVIADLKNPALRDRHWRLISEELRHSLDPSNAEFTLEKIIPMEIDKYADKVHEISLAASKELVIEQGLEEIMKTWRDTFLDVVPYRNKGHYQLRDAEKVYQVRDDNQVILTSMRSSGFVKAFEQEVDSLECRQSLVLEVIEMILTVQNQWMCLESIFGRQDIQKQLPDTWQEFKDTSADWKTIMTRLHQNNNALEGTHHPGFLEKLTQIFVKLEEIQKNMESYLEMKRQIFPRFYFLSNSDLLKVLAHSQSPEAVLPYLKKCFDNIQSLSIQEGDSKPVAVGMFSADGEFVSFAKPVELHKPVEDWLCDVEKSMYSTLKLCLKNCQRQEKWRAEQRRKGCQTWIKNFPGQILITVSQIQWTTDVANALTASKEAADRSALKSLRLRQVSITQGYAEIIRGSLSNVERLKTAALLTVEVHGRQVIDKLAEAGCDDVDSFEWLSQLRFYGELQHECVIRQTNTHFKYGYEYLGNSGRLAITPLTDRCYMTLTMALYLHRGAYAIGPCGTGKMETVKDLGKALGMFVIAFHCFKELDYKSMGRLFSGLAQTGAWGCFRDFNRISADVLSVVSQQILSILSTLSAGQSTFQLDGHHIQLMGSCGIFFTMKSGCARHTELPEHLKSAFRPISMIMPDTVHIIKTILFGEGFYNRKLLAKKVVALYSLAEQQLSKQDHYDFGLRALISMLRYVGIKRRSCPDVPDEEILLVAIKDMNNPKLTSSDLPLFHGLIDQLFPAVETPSTDHGTLQEAMEMELRQMGLQVTAFTMSKVIQLYETKTSRHATVLVGNTGSGKSVSWMTLKNVSTSLHHKGVPGFQPVQTHVLNPKAMSLSELYGHHDLATNEWKDGVVSYAVRSVCADEKPDEKWIVFDGPVDSLWTESMNSLMDDNKALTLINGERFVIPERVSLLFEVENLAMASPATVSRCGMVYHDSATLGWKPFVQSWLEKRPKAEADHLQSLFEKYVESILNFKRTKCKELIPITDLNGVMSLCRLYDSLATSKNGVNTSDTESLGTMVNLWFIFSLIWSICASVDEAGRMEMNYFLQGMVPSLPIESSIFECCVDVKRKKWTVFVAQLPKNWRYNSNTPFYKILVPTVDRVRYSFVVKALVMGKHPVLITGPAAAGKTSLAQMVLHELDEKWTSLTVNMSPQTTSENIQVILENLLEKRTKDEFLPSGRKQLLCFLDDLNMPAHDPCGSQPPLELLRFWIDHGFWYDRHKHTPKYVKNMFLLASMGPPGGVRTQISSRLQSRFSVINMTFPERPQLEHIYCTIISQKLEKFREDVKPIGEVFTQATFDLYDDVSGRFLPTPAKAHYLFSIRDISKVFQGLLRADSEFHDTKKNLTRLWIHECFRVFSDRLVDQQDMDDFVALLESTLSYHFKLKLHNICPNRQPPIFGDILGNYHVYEDIQDMESLKKFLETKLEDYNTTPGIVPMNLVLFKSAIEHIIRIVRVISQHRGNMVLAGTAGTGRQSLSKMAAFLCEYQVFQVGVTKQYCRKEFREDIKKLYRLTGVDNKPTVFLFSDTQLLDESFLEDISVILSNTDVPNLYKQDEFDEICSLVLESAKKDKVAETPQSLFSYLIERIRKNLHVVLCMNPTRENFRRRILQYPAIINFTSIDWFCDWSRDALLEVADRYLHGLELGSMQGIQTKIANIFVTTHQTVVQMSKKLKLELHSHNYVTPTNYIELLSGYKRLLAEKRSELGEKVNKLRQGLSNIAATSAKVEAMSVELEEAKNLAAECQTQCIRFLSGFKQQNLEADKQQQVVIEESGKIKTEELHCKAIADNAQKDLDEAMPALDAAMKALESLNKADMTEIKSYSCPPAPVELVMQAVMTLLGRDPTWAEAKRLLSDSHFINTLVHFDKDNISDSVMFKVIRYCRQPNFQPDIIGKVSLAAKSLCMWVIAMKDYGHIYRVVEPKRAQFKAAMAQLEEKQAALVKAQKKLQEVEDQREYLNRLYNETEAKKVSLEKRSAEMTLKMDQANKLVHELSGERDPLEEKVASLEENMRYLVGDCVLGASFLSYMGPFFSRHRANLLDILIKEVQDSAIPCTPQFRFADFLSKPTTTRDWNIQGLPSGAFFTENGLIVTRSDRWPLMVDPQSQGLEWVKNMEMERGLKVIDFQMPDYLQVLQSAIRLGKPVLLQNVQEELEPSFYPVLRRSLRRIDGRLLLNLGDKELEYNPEFRLYIATKLPNPHYSPEISAKTSIINFTVKEQSLETKLLGTLLRRERPELEERKDSTEFSIISDKKRLQELKDEFLSLVEKATGSLDDEQLVSSLQTCIKASAELSAQLESSQQSKAETEAFREAYRPCAQRAAILFLLLNDMRHINPMYQFSLDYYADLFDVSIRKSKCSSKLEERITSLIDYHTYAVYKSVSRGLFDVHKLLFSFQMCVKILEAAGKLDMDEYNFFIRGGLVRDRQRQTDNPCSSWLPDSSWVNITHLATLQPFRDITKSFERRPEQWKKWFSSTEPENAALPDFGEGSCTELQRMLILRSLRPDRVSLCISSFVVNTLGRRFVESPLLDLTAVVKESTCRTPLIFVLAPGVDPTGDLLQLAEASGMSTQFHALSLGRDQAHVARSMIEEGVQNGHWVFLANCHLCLSLLPELDVIVKQLQVEEPHPNFRLWLSSLPHPTFPVAILQAGIKMTTEPPKGVKANMKHLFQLATEAQVTRCSRPDLFRKLLFSLCFFHSILQERKRFLHLGWNTNYSFSQSDFEMSRNLLRMHLNKYEEVPWDALKVVIGGTLYGGHVTDEWDRRLLMTYMDSCFCDAAVTQPLFRLSSLPSYCIPSDNSESSYQEYISTLPSTDQPEVFGQHPNADVAGRTVETRTLLETLLSLQPQVSPGCTAEGAEPSKEDKVLQLLEDICSNIPAPIDEEAAILLLKEEASTLNMVLLQEVQRYNKLLETIILSLRELEKGIKGLVLMSSSMEEIFHCIYDGRVPPLWGKVYPSLKPLAAWIRDLGQRIHHFTSWVEAGKPPTLVWLPGFTNPNCFLTAVLQSYAQQHYVSVAKLSWKFTVSTVDDINIHKPPEDGVYVQGLYLEGAAWDKINSCLKEPEPLQMVCPMPAVHFQPVKLRMKPTNRVYCCPCYRVSGSAGRESFVVTVRLSSGAVTSDHWIKRGAALLLSLDD
ncbi:uncharacterized protein V6R79_005381 [Siganus canaliculatus]